MLFWYHRIFFVFFWSSLTSVVLRLVQYKFIYCIAEIFRWCLLYKKILHVKVLGFFFFAEFSWSNFIIYIQVQKQHVQSRNNYMVLEVQVSAFLILFVWNTLNVNQIKGFFSFLCLNLKKSEGIVLCFVSWKILIRS